MITKLQLAEWKQMAAEAEACFRAGRSQMSYLAINLVKSFGLEMATHLPDLINELEKLQGESE